MFLFNNTKVLVINIFVFSKKKRFLLIFVCFEEIFGRQTVYLNYSFTPIDG